MNWIEEKAKLEKKICCLQDQIAAMTPTGVVVPSYQREVLVDGIPATGTPRLLVINSLSICGNQANAIGFSYSWDGVAVADVLQAIVDFLNTDFVFLGTWSLVGGTDIVLETTLLLACDPSISIIVSVD